MDIDTYVALHKVRGATLWAILALDHARTEDPHADASSELADEQLALACRDVVRAINAGSKDEWPVGWDETASEAAATA